MQHDQVGWRAEVALATENAHAVRIGSRSKIAVKGSVLLSAVMWYGLFRTGGSSAFASRNKIPMRTLAGNRSCSFCDLTPLPTSLQTGSRLRHCACL